MCNIANIASNDKAVIAAMLRTIAHKDRAHFWFWYALAAKIEQSTLTPTFNRRHND